QTKRAGLLLDTWLVVARGGFSSVHLIRAVTRSEAFVHEYLLPRLGEQDAIGEGAEGLVRARGVKRSNLPGIDDLDAHGEGDGSAPAYDLKPLIQLVEKDGGHITLPGGGDERIETDRAKAALHAA